MEDINILCVALCRMASFLCGHEVFQISVNASYGVTEFKADLLTLYAKAGSKGTKVTFLLTDSNIIQERFLVYINDLLSTGHVADLCTPVSLLDSRLSCFDLLTATTDSALFCKYMT